MNAGHPTVTAEQPPATRPLPAAPAVVVSAPQRRRRWPQALAATLAAMVTAAAVVALASDRDTGPRPLGTGANRLVAAAPATGPPAPAPTPVPTTTPRTIGSLVDLLGASPGGFGERGSKLLDELAKIQGDDGSGRDGPGRSSRLQRDIQRWMARGELDPTIGTYALEVLGERSSVTVPIGDEGRRGRHGVE